MGGNDTNPGEHSKSQICKASYSKADLTSRLVLSNFLQIADFGLALQLPVSDRLRNRLRQRGTPGYYAPVCSRKVPLRPSRDD